MFLSDMLSLFVFIPCLILLFKKPFISPTLGLRVFAPVWCHSSVLDSLLCAELSRGCSSAAPATSIPRFHLKPSQERPPRSSLLLSLLREVCGTWSCSELCPTVLAWGRFLSLIPVIVVTSLLEPGGILIPLIRAGSLDFAAALGGRECDSI